MREKHRGKQKMKTKKYIDLHQHTIYSDGSSLPEQIIFHNKMKGLDVIAISDHDNYRGYEKARPEAIKWGITLIPGVEITTDKFHILGLNFDPTNDKFKKYIEYSRDLQERNTKKRIRRLQEQGVPIRFETVKELFPKSRLGKINLTVAMMQDENCRRYLKHNHGTTTFREVLKQIVSSSGLVGDFNRINTGPQTAIKQIHSAKGIAILAHPPKDVDDMSELDELVACGLDGIEVQPLILREKYEPYIEYARENGLLITYGSDFHGPEVSRSLLGRKENVMSEELEERLFGIKKTCSQEEPLQTPYKQNLRKLYEKAPFDGNLKAIFLKGVEKISEEEAKEYLERFRRAADCTKEAFE